MWHALAKMTWGSKRRARLANIVGDAGKIVLATTVVSPFARPGPAAWWLVLTGSVITGLLFAFAVWAEKEEPI